MEKTEEIKKFIDKWDEEIAMHRRVVEDSLMWTKEDRLKSSYQAQAICAVMYEFKKLLV